MKYFKKYGFRHAARVYTRKAFSFETFSPVGRAIGRTVTRSSLEREVSNSNLGPVKSDTNLSTSHHRCNISLTGAVLPGRNDAEMGLPNSFNASA